MLDSIFYFQIVIGVAFFAFGFLRKESSFMALAAVILGVTGLMLLSGVPMGAAAGVSGSSACLEIGPSIHWFCLSTGCSNK